VNEKQSEKLARQVVLNKARTFRTAGSRASKAGSGSFGLNGRTGLGVTTYPKILEEL